MAMTSEGPRREQPTGERPASAARPSTPRSSRSRSSSGAARSCSSARPSGRRSTSSPPARSPWTSRSASAASRAAGSPRSSARSRRARPRSASTSSPRPSGGAASPPSSTSSTPWIPGYARACGVNVDELLVSQPDTGEQALEITETLIRSGGVDVVVVDSVAALVPRAEIEGEMGDSFVGIQARLMSQALRKLTGAVSRSNTSLVFTNQLREKIGVMFGNPESRPAAAPSSSTPASGSTSGASRRSRPARSRSATASGSRSSRTRSRRRSASPSSTSCTARGSRREGGLLDVGVAMDVVTKTGAWFTFGETRLGQGREAAKEFLKREPGDRAPRSRAGSGPGCPSVALPVEGIEEAE